MIVACNATIHAEMWSCTEPDGSVTFRDHGGPGCQELRTLKEMPTVPTPKAPAPAAAPPTRRDTPPPKSAAPSDKKELASYAFGPVMRSVPSLLVSDLPESVRAKGFTMPNKGDIVLVSVRVAHLPGGAGPVITMDGHFRPDAGVALRRSVYAAAIGTGYDPRYLDVALTLPAASMFDHGYQVDG
ncbi:MAG TPA: DUF4124 domain-containing protein, partial [Nitrospirales bacterium]|nr:DUF4124 domain-containing protein [Nitrospirales bacterium]